MATSSPLFPPLPVGLVAWLFMTAMASLFVAMDTKSVTARVLGLLFAASSFSLGIIPMPYVWLAANATVVSDVHQLASGTGYSILFAFEASLLSLASLRIVELLVIAMNRGKIED